MTSVRITRPRHPLRGHPLRVLGRMRRHARLELLLELPDGSKRWIPQAWTDAEQDTTTSDGVATLGSLADLLAASALSQAGSDAGRGSRERNKSTSGITASGFALASTHSAPAVG